MVESRLSRMKCLYIILKLIILAMAVSIAQAMENMPCDRLNLSPGRLLYELMKESDGKPSAESDIVLAFANHHRNESWLLTKRGHPAHPAIACKTLVRDGDEFKNIVRVQRAGPNAACQAFLQQFAK
jgi:hypothetical protein